MNLLQDKVAIVTGAGSGIGRSIAQRFAANGARVLVSDIDEEGGAETLKMIKDEGGTAQFFRADVGKAEENEALVRHAVKTYGGLHVACNNAGIGGPQAPIGEYPLDGWRQVMDINLNGVFYGMRYQIPAMLEAGGGTIVNMASILGQVGFQGAGAYVTAKHGMLGLTKSAALEYASAGLRVNAVGPAFIRTPLLTDNFSDEELEQLVQLHPIGRLGRPEEVAELVLWLSSDKASFVTGSYYPVDGAYLAQ